ncbi:hypothetical protein STSP2_01416 [Anaerohalosphaera lusitana]|uniref:Uncharacterized protein n=2 Tax=Anaerohalosphaera lusitana TaxID=1936003 RepID=A0A1U9NKZ6_9BACT|nr:hypothetical protein STSP2_01416 [Anaerohalosphaera lusitana]
MKKPQAHHDLPQKFKDRFSRLGLDINNPKHMRWVEGGPHGNHQKWSHEFNKQWERFFQNPDVTAKDAVKFMNNLRQNTKFQ